MNHDAESDLVFAPDAPPRYTWLDQPPPPALRRQMFAVHQAAYAHEAEVLGVQEFFPLTRTPDNFLNSSDVGLVAQCSGHAAGHLVAEPGSPPDGAGIEIASLVVHPAAHRRGIGRSLLRQALHRWSGRTITVSTAQRNLPAVRLYLAEGFVIDHQVREPHSGLDLVRFRHGGPSR